MQNSINLFAGSIILDKRKWFIFMFNPFAEEVMTKFIANNIQMLTETESIVGYANARELKCISNFNPKKIIEIPAYKCAFHQNW